MPRAQLPKTAKGWAIASVASMVGFISGLYALNVLNKVWK